MSVALLKIENLSVAFGRRQAVRGIDLEIRAGERLALVGESGSGKTVTALSILRLLERARLDGQILLQGRDLLALPLDELREIRGRDVAMIFQEPMTALNPLHTIGRQIVETLLLHSELNAVQARERAIQLLTRTGLRDHEVLAADRGWTPVTTAATPDDHKAYYPGATPIHIRITGDQRSGRLLGAQLVGHRSAEVSKRVDTYATALFHEMTVDGLSALDLSYTPPLGSPCDATQMAAQVWTRTLLSGAIR